ncbi:hypothetical protein [Crocosphaera chwakensis]|uniref:Uncharacterized protein n=1 Tax=Crocosphaera chwakensis CCY0110 TaxID=391612 RepID=A3IVW8_9CHRO|nr:hypothetical protein [Crocosphaera chwakensis]EAZ89354.1 hypothetical protein CY0110_30775 [Crocosphaera chwakensis CCY0110]
MYSEYVKVKSCRLCSYLDLEEDFCAVAPKYLGKAYLCQNFKLRETVETPEKEKNSTRFKFQIFSRNYLESLLHPYGKIERERGISWEGINDDLWFSSTGMEAKKHLGLLGKMLDGLVLFEVYDNPVTSEEVSGSLFKILDMMREQYREAKAVKKPEPKLSDLAHLWILTPSVSQEVLEGFRGQLLEGWGEGVYFMPPGMRTGVVVIDSLAKNGETLWLRLLGRGEVQKQAREELKALPSTNLVGSKIRKLMKVE